MEGRLYVVATPIGNLEDVTLRALRVLRTVSLIAAEDTRRTRRLLVHAGIETPMTSLHGHNERRATARVMGELATGRDVALVSDAGTPLLSDPGFDLVRQALDAGLRVEPVPGPSALLAALVMSGVTSNQFTFLGFPPARGKERRTWLQTLARERRTVVCFEAPHRVRRTLEDVANVVGNCSVAVCRELTKIHEELVKGPISAVMASAALQRPMGEFTLVFDLSEWDQDADADKAHASDDEIATEFGRITELGDLTMPFSRRRAIASVAKHYGISLKDAYAAVERVKRRCHGGHV